MAFDSKVLMQTYLDEVVQNGRIELIEELAHADVIDEANLAFRGPPGRAGLIAHARGFNRNITKVKVTVKRIVGDQTSVMAWWSFTGIHAGPWLGRPQSDKPISGNVFSFFDLVDGKISRYSLYLHAAFDDPMVFDSTSPQLFQTRT